MKNGDVASIEIRDGHVVRALDHVMLGDLVGPWIPELVGELMLALELDDAAVGRREPIHRAEDLGVLEMLDDLGIRRVDVALRLVGVETRDHGLEPMTELEEKDLVLGRLDRFDLGTEHVERRSPGIEPEDRRGVGSAYAGATCLEPLRPRAQNLTSGTSVSFAITGSRSSRTSATIRSSAAILVSFDCFSARL